MIINNRVYEGKNSFFKRIGNSVVYGLAIGCVFVSVAIGVGAGYLCNKFSETSKEAKELNRFLQNELSGKPGEPTFRELIDEISKRRISGEPNQLEKEADK